MIEVQVVRSQFGVSEVTISGHAHAGKHGQDIVCSAVSAVSLGTLNGIQPLLGFVPDVELAEKGGGFIKWRVQELADERLHEQQQLLAESMIITLVGIAHRYGKYVVVHDTKWQGGATQ